MGLTSSVLGGGDGGKRPVPSTEPEVVLLVWEWTCDTRQYRDSRRPLFEGLHHSTPWARTGVFTSGRSQPTLLRPRTVRGVSTHRSNEVDSLGREGPLPGYRIGGTVMDL